MPKQGHTREVSDEEIHQLLREIDRQPVSPASDARIKRPQSYSEANVERELTVDEILQKIQRDIEQT